MSFEKDGMDLGILLSHLGMEDEDNVRKYINSTSFLMSAHEISSV